MKVTVLRPVEIEVAKIHIDVPVRYDEEDIPKDFPVRVGDQWAVTVGIDTGVIEGWPEGKTGDMYMKVTDAGTYTLLAPDGSEVAKIDENYVPAFFPGEHYGDYLIFDIDGTGRIRHWPSKPELSEFFPNDASE